MQRYLRTTTGKSKPMNPTSTDITEPCDLAPDCTGLNRCYSPSTHHTYHHQSTHQQIYVISPHRPLRDPDPHLRIDATFSKSSQRRRRYPSSSSSSSSRDGSVHLLRLLFFLPLILSLLLHPVTARSESSVLFLSPEDLGVELSDDLSAVNADSDGADTEQGEDEDEVDDVLSPVVAEDSEESFTELGLQKGTFVIDELDEGDNELGRPRVEHISDIVRGGRARVYANRLHVDFKHMLYLPSQKALYVVANGATLIKLDAKTLTPLDVYSIPPQKQPSPYCQLLAGCRQRNEINVLARTPKQHLLFYCSLHYEEHPGGIRRQALTGCAVPDPTNLSDNMLQWDNMYYTSSDPHRPPVILTPQLIDKGEDSSAAPFFYAAGVVSNSVYLSRLRMPDWSNGHISWKGSLFSSRRNFFINEPATVVMSFETSTAIYFLLREKPAPGTPLSAKTSSSSAACDPDQFASRLVRVCRGDRGGLQSIAENYFGTMAKANLLCHSETATAGSPARSHFTFRHAEAAHWDPDAQRLYAIFTGGAAAPRGSAVCVYDLQGIERAFSGPIAVAGTGNQRDSVRKNPFPDICERFSGQGGGSNLTENELSLGRIGVTFMYRHDPVRPLFGHAVAMSRHSVTWTSVLGYRLPGNSLATVLWLASNQRVSQLVFYESPQGGGTSSSASPPKESPVLVSTCELRNLAVGEEREDLLEKLRTGGSKRQETPSAASSAVEWSLPLPPPQLKEMTESEHYLENPPESPEREQINGMLIEGGTIFLATTSTIFRFPTDNCSAHASQGACLSSADLHCAWSPKRQRCLSLLLNQSGGDQLIPAVNTTRIGFIPQCPSQADQSDDDDDTDSNDQSGWSTWRPCRMMHDTKSQENTKISCLCRVCLSESLCNFGEQEVSHCKVKGVWSPWSSWSRCIDKLRFRTRICYDPLSGPHRLSFDCVGPSREEDFCLMHPLVPEEVVYPEMMASRDSEEARSGNRLGVDKKHLVGGILGIFVGTMVTLITVLIFLRFCRSHHRKKRNKNLRTLRLASPVHATINSRRNITLERQIRQSLLPDHLMYATPSPVQTSLHSSGSQRYNYLLLPPRISPISADDLSASAGGVYDRLSDK